MEEWKLIVPKDGISVVDLIGKILNKYPDIDPTASKNLCFQYHSYGIITKRKGNKEKAFKQFNKIIKCSEQDILRGRIVSYPGSIELTQLV